MRIEEQHTDVLQNLEFMVATVYRENPDMADYAALRAYEALIEIYSAERSGRSPRLPPLSPLEQELVERLHEMCEWRLGRADPSNTPEDERSEPLPVETLILCLKRLVKSVNTWTRRSVRQGYLSFMLPYSLAGPT